MQDYAEYIEQCLRDFPMDDTAFRYKRSVLEKMNARTKEIRARGLTDERVLNELVIDETRELVPGYKKYLRDLKFKHRLKRLPVISVVYVIGLVFAFLALGFGSEYFLPQGHDLWHPGWLIIEAGVSALFIGLLLFFVPRLSKTKWYFVARLCVAGSVMIAAQAIYLLARILSGEVMTYLMMIAAPAVMLLGDLILATVTRQRMLILSYLLYIPGIAALLYALLGLTGTVPWDPGWLIMIGAVFADILVVLGVLAYKKKYTYKPEKEEDA